MKLFFDGASRGNPGKASYGAVLYDDNDKEIATTKGCLGKTTNNVAEYNGIVHGMKMCRDSGVKQLVVYGDSNLIVKQLNGEWKVRNADMKTLYDQVKKLEPSFESIKYEHVRRKKNKRTDQLANEALDETT